MIVWISRRLPIRPVVQLSLHLTRVCLHAHSHVNGLGSGKLKGIKFPGLPARGLQSVSRILRWVFNRAWVVEPVWRREA